MAPGGHPAAYHGRVAPATLLRCYGLFHFCLTAAADEFIGVTQRGTSRYALVYRSIGHRTLKDLCAEARKQAPPMKYVPYLPAGGFDSNIQAFSTAAIDLQEKRNRADYNPQAKPPSPAVRQHQPGRNQRDADAVVDMEKFAKEHHRQNRAEHLHQMHVLPGAAGADQLDAAVEREIGEE